MLQQGIKLGARVTKYHQIWSFSQSKFISPWVKTNIERRAAAKSKWEGDTWKLVNNTFYGMFGIDPSKFKNFEVVTDLDQARRLVGKHNFDSFQIISEKMVIVNMLKQRVVMKNHLLVSGAILDLSKMYFYKLFYGLKNHFKSRITPMYEDTDSILMELRVDNLWEALAEVKLDGKPIMDFSFLSVKDPYYSAINKKTPGMINDDNWKGEDGRFIAKACVNRKKAYGLKFFQNPVGKIHKDKKKFKGITAVFLSDETFQSYYDAIFTKQVKRVKVRMFRSMRLQIQTIAMKKLAFTPVNDSRYLLGEYGIESLPYGHYSLVNKTLPLLVED